MPVCANLLGSAQRLAPGPTGKVEPPGTGVDTCHCDHGRCCRFHPASDGRIPARPTGRCAFPFRANIRLVHFSTLKHTTKPHNENHNVEALFWEDTLG